MILHKNFFRNNKQIVGIDGYICILYNRFLTKCLSQ